jgi:D-beta-D-heptose 7-phosphate kinase/D-beta-D-heptose 1-phosphate adenosyltransferase
MTETPEKILDLDRLLVSSSPTAASISCMSVISPCWRTADDLAPRSLSGSTATPRFRGLKGSGRPIVGERERARILAALAATGAIVIFDAPTPIDLIVALRPDVLVKGGDYTEESVVGAREVRIWGGRIVIVPTVEGFSTTNIVREVAHSVDR